MFKVAITSAMLASATQSVQITALFEFNSPNVEGLPRDVYKHMGCRIEDLPCGLKGPYCDKAVSFRRAGYKHMWRDGKELYDLMTTASYRVKNRYWHQWRMFTYQYGNQDPEDPTFIGLVNPNCATRDDEYIPVDDIEDPTFEDVIAGLI